MSFPNEAALLVGVGTKLEVGPVPSPELASNEVRIQTRAVAMNPVDQYMRDLDLPGFNFTYPCTFGIDVSGDVVEVGDQVANLSKGQRVLWQTTGLSEGKQERRAFQKYVVAPSKLVLAISDDWSYEEAASMPVSLSVAGAGLYMTNQLALPYPTANPKPSGKTIVVLGGSSSMGCSTIQLARASGYEVVATASPRNFDLCKSLGAAAVIDYNSKDLEKDLRAALEGKDFPGVHICTKDINAMEILGKILDERGGGIMAQAPLVPENVSIPSSVKLEFFNADWWTLSDYDGPTYLWQEFLPQAIKNKQVRPAPKVHVYGHGLDQIDGALTYLAKGVSATKVVVTI